MFVWRDSRIRLMVNLWCWLMKFFFICVLGLMFLSCDFWWFGRVCVELCIGWCWEIFVVLCLECVCSLIDVFFYWCLGCWGIFWWNCCVGCLVVWDWCFSCLVRWGRCWVCVVREVWVEVVLCVFWEVVWSCWLLGCVVVIGRGWFYWCLVVFWWWFLCVLRVCGCCFYVLLWGLILLCWKMIWFFEFIFWEFFLKDFVGLSVVWGSLLIGFWLFFWECCFCLVGGWEWCFFKLMVFVVLVVWWV